MYLSVRFDPKQTRVSKYHFDCCWLNLHWVREKVVMVNISLLSTVTV